ncbi:MAG: Cdc6/Cdc18 family protein [Candidatus Hodarchaeota archaeon]
MLEIIEDEINAPSVFTDEEKFSFEYIPSNLLHREQQMRKLASYFRNLFQGAKNFRTTVLITGEVGTGKTTLSKIFGLMIEKSGQNRNKKIKYIHINCRKLNKASLILANILGKLIPHFPLRGFSTAELIRILRDTLDQKNMSLLLSLDEIDFLLKNDVSSDLLYNLARLNEDSIKQISGISLIIISRFAGLHRELDKLTRSSFPYNVIHLEKYDKNQFLDILKERAKDGLRQGALSEESLIFLAESAVEIGDTRYAIELLWRSGKIADQERSDFISTEHIQKAKVKVYPFSESTLHDLPLHQKFVLLALSKGLSTQSIQGLNIGDLEEYYRQICLEYNAKPRKHTRIWYYVQQLASLGIISVRIRNEDMRGRTTYITLPNISSKLLSEKVQEIVENSSK